jgi:hypothetical protein
MSQQERKKKPYTAPSFVRVDAKTAKAALESKAVPGDMNAKAMLKLVTASTAEQARQINIEIQLPSADHSGEMNLSAHALQFKDLEVLRKMLALAEEVLRLEKSA